MVSSTFGDDVDPLRPVGSATERQRGRGEGATSYQSVVARLRFALSRSDLKAGVPLFAGNGVRAKIPGRVPWESFECSTSLVVFRLCA